MKMTCANCALLDKSKKRTAGGCWQYGCKAKKKYEWSEYNTGWIPCWIGDDRLLDDLHAGSCWMPIVENPRQMTIDEILRGSGKL